jgi:hydrophobic/amphiphilic exporter-1 (mainly G- bacteria), HAE1 family
VREWLPALSFDRPVSVFMLLVAMLVVGAIAWVQIPIQMLPSGFEPGFLWVSVPWNDASPVETDERIVRPLEAQFGTVSGLSRVRSYADEGRGSFALEFHSSVDMDEAYNSVLDRIERSMSDLPEDIGRYRIFRYNPNDSPIIWAGVSLPDDVEDPRHVLTSIVQPQLERIGGVASINIWGVPQRSVWVDYDKDRLFGAGVDLGEFQRKLSADNFQMASGEIQDRGLNQHARSLARIEGLEDLRRYPVKEGVVLEDVAEVSMRSSISSDLNRVNGEQAAAFALMKESNANTVQVSSEVERVLKELEADPRLKGVTFFIFFNQGELIGESIDILTTTALTGGVFALIILYLFLREWKMTLLIATSIPFSLLITVGVIYAQGMSLNLLSLMGLMLAVGMVVDNAIVVVETIYRRRSDGAGVREAAIGGTAEVNLAILMSTLTTMVVFLPVILMTENQDFSFFLGVIGFPVVFALAASLMVALIFAPLATRYMGQAAIREDPIWLKAVTRRYLAVLGWVLRNRVDASVALMAIGILTYGIAVPGVDCTSSADENLNDFAIRFEVPPQYGMRDRDAALSAFEEVVEENREAWGVRVYRGELEGGSVNGRVRVYLDSDGPMSRSDVMDAAKEVLPDDIPGVRGSVGWDSGEDGGGNSVTLRITGEDMSTLMGLAEEMARRLDTVPSSLGAHLDVLNEGANEIQLQVEREVLGRYGVSAMTVGQSVGYAMRSNQLPDLVLEDKSIPISSSFSLEDRGDLDAILDFEVWSPALMSLVPVRALTTMEMSKGPQQIRREQRQTSVSVTMDIHKDTPIFAVFPEIDAAMADMVFPRGYGWERGMKWNSRQEEDNAVYFAMMLSMAFVFLLMGMLFESWILPMSILTTIPMAMVGAMWGLYLTGTSMDSMGFVGLIILVGVVVNNGIVLVDLVTQLRAGGMDRQEALLQAGERRIRPILMTALTTICGLLPMALGSSDFIGIPYAPLGRVVIGGLISATLLTLLFVPYLYALLDDLRSWSGTWFAFVRRAHS